MEAAKLAALNPMTTNIPIEKMKLNSIHISAAFAQFALLIGVLLPNAHTKIKTMLTKGMHSKSPVTIHSPILTGLYVGSSMGYPLLSYFFCVKSQRDLICFEVVGYGPDDFIFVFIAASMNPISTVPKQSMIANGIAFLSVAEQLVFLFSTILSFGLLGIIV